MNSPVRPTMAKRGSIGESWWSRRFIDPLERTGDRGRLGRGRTYARGGSVLRVEVSPGVAVAKVQGSRSRPYTVTVGYQELGDERWSEVCRVLGNKALYRSALLAGEMPAQIEEEFLALGIPLFPEHFDDLDTSCSCPAWGHPCKHVAAVLYVLADSFDADPFLVLAWLGRDREALLAEIREHSPGGAANAEPEERGLAVRLPPLESRTDTFWAAEEPPALAPAPTPMSPLAYLDEDASGLAASLEPLYAKLSAELDNSSA